MLESRALRILLYCCFLHYLVFLVFCIISDFKRYRRGGEVDGMYMILPFVMGGSQSQVLGCCIPWREMSDTKGNIITRASVLKLRGGRHSFENTVIPEFNIFGSNSVFYLRI